jgi:hypothetical protein
MIFSLKNTWMPLVVLSILVLFLGNCKKTGGDTALVVLNIFPHVGTDSLVLGKTFVNPSGRNFTFSQAQYYVSDINMVSTDGTLQPITGVLLVTPQTTQYILGSVPIGVYKSIQFNIGVDGAYNHIDPANQNPGSPLALTNMHFASDTLGYIFLALQGQVDTSTAGPGTPNISYSYNIGTDTLFEKVSLPDHSVAPYNAVFNATGGKLVSVNLVADFNSLLKNLDMKVNRITNSSDYPVVADTIAAHIPQMFSYQQ